MDVELRTERFRELKPAEAFVQAAKDGTIKEGLQKMEPCAQKEQCQSAAEGEPLYVKIKHVTDPPPVLLKVDLKTIAPEVTAASGEPEAAAMKVIAPEVAAAGDEPKAAVMKAIAHEVAAAGGVRALACATGRDRFRERNTGRGTLRGRRVRDLRLAEKLEL